MFLNNEARKSCANGYIRCNAFDALHDALPISDEELRGAELRRIPCCLLV